MILVRSNITLGNEAISETEAAIIQALKDREMKKLSETYNSTTTTTTNTTSESANTSNQNESSTTTTQSDVRESEKPLDKYERGHEPNNFKWYMPASKVCVHGHVLGRVNAASIALVFIANTSRRNKPHDLNQTKKNSSIKQIHYDSHKREDQRGKGCDFFSVFREKHDDETTTLQH